MATSLEAVPAACDRDARLPESVASSLHWILRIAVSACFVGDGAFGIITKAAWVPSFERQIAPDGEAWRFP